MQRQEGAAPAKAAGWLVRSLWRWVLGCLLGLSATSALAQANLQISSFTYDTPVLNGSTQAFTVVAKNIGDASATNARLRVFLPENFTFSSAPAGCFFEDAPHVFGANNNPDPAYTTSGTAFRDLRMMYCDYASVVTGTGGDKTLNFSGVASATAPPQVANMVADYYSDTVESVATDNYEVKGITVNSGADLALAATPIVVTVGGSPVANGGTVISGKELAVSVATQNNGPNEASQAQVVITLPSTSNLTSGPVPTGTPWACTNSNNTVTCLYGGAAAAAGAAFPSIALTGTLRANTTGSVSFTASISSPPNTDPVLTNNGPSTLTLNIAPGLDLRASKSLRFGGSDTTSVAYGSAAVFRIGIINDGPWDLPAGGAQVVDALDAGWTLGTLPSGCTAVGQTVTCVNAALLATGGNTSFDIPVTAPASGTPGGPNVATVSLTPAGTSVVSESNTTNNTAVVTYTWGGAVADLSLNKAKNRVSGSGPLITGEQMSSVITVTNQSASTAYATGTITVKDTLDNFPLEKFVSASGGTSPQNWVCNIPNAASPADSANAVVTCTLAAPVGGYAPGATLPPLTVITVADLGTLANNSQSLTNTACTGKTADSNYALDVANANDCKSASLTGTTLTGNITFTKTTNASGNKILETTEDTFTYTLVVTNTSGSTIPTLILKDTIPLSRQYPTPVGTTLIVPTIPIVRTGEVCNVTIAITPTSNGLVECALKDVAVGESRTVLITVKRPLDSGTNVNNTALLSSPDAVLTGTLSASDVVTVLPQTEIAVSKSANPTSVRAGQSVAFTLTVDVNGPDGANDLELFDHYDDARFELEGGFTINGVPSGTTCVAKAIGANETGDADFDGHNGIYCNLGNVAIDTLGSRKTLTIGYSAVPKFPYPDAFNATYTNKALVKTSSSEPSTQRANNKTSVNVTILPPEVDLSVTKTDVVDPVEWDDSATTKAQISYLIKAISANTSISRARNVKVIDVPQPPAGFTMTFVSHTVNAGSTHTPSGGVTCTPTNVASSTSYVTCSFADLPSGKQVWLDMTFNLDRTGSSPARAMSFSNAAKICADEGAPDATSQTADPVGSSCGFASLANYDLTPADNRITEKTTILPLTDLHAYYKRAVASGTTTEITSIQLNEAFDYLVKVRNKGPVDSFLATVTDVLPAGFRRTSSPVIATPGSGVGAVNGNTCSSAIASDLETVTCTMGPLPPDSTSDGSEDATKSWTIRIPVKADPVVFAAANQVYNTNIPNTASIAPALDPDDTSRPLSKDRNSANNTATGNILVPVKASLAGRVFEGASLSTAPTGSEPGIGGVTLTLTGLDDNGVACSTPSASTNLACGVTRTLTTTAGTGAYLFDNLPPGRYTVEETQPSSHYDGPVFLGTRTIGAGPAGTTSTGFVATGAKNSIANISLANNEVATNYNFEEYKPVIVSGVVFDDTNNDGLKGVSEAGLAGAVLRLSGTSYTGAALSLSDVTTVSDGVYSFSAPPTNDAAGYTVTERTEPPTTLDGKDYDGSAVVSGSAGRSAGTDAHTVSSGLVPGASFPNRNFGELKPASIAGAAYIDSNTNAIKNVGEPVISNVTFTLTGTNDLGAAVSTTVTSSMSVNGGQYLFANLRPGTYTVTETQPAGLENTGAQVGSGTNGTATGANVTPATLSAIALAANDVLTDYNFGHKGSLLSGVVYIDTNRNGVRDTNEPGIAGVNVSLSGSAFNGQDVCTLVTCTQATGADGSYQFINLPASNNAGYTVRETDGSGTPSPVLSLYGDGAETLGSLGGSVGADQFSGIVLSTNGAGSGYNFGEWGARLAGTVYFDADNSGTQGSGEAGIAGVKVTLSGNTALGGAVCGVMPSGVCTASQFEVLTDSSGDYLFDNLPGADGTGFVLTETHPTIYQDGKETVGTVASVVKGSAPNTGFDANAVNNRISAITLGAGQQGSGYLFGELASGLSGFVYIDADNSGTKDVGEPGIVGVLITLTGLDSSGNAVTRTATTDAQGYYNFPNLPTSNGTGYTLTETHPAGYLDGKETAGTVATASVGVVDNTAFSTADVNNRITGVVLTGGATAVNYLFGERGGRLNGVVYVDTNNNALKDSGETGLPGVSVTLSGLTDANQDVCALGFSCVVSTDANGAFSFSGVPPGTYKLVENQAGVDGALYGDGKETAGVAGGTVHNSTQGSLPYQNTIDAITVTTGVLASSGGNVGGYLFGEVPRNVTGLLPPIVSGYVYMDRAHARVRPEGDSLEGQSGWTVTLSQNGNLLCTVSTNANGFYQFDNLHCPGYSSGLPTGSGFSVRFTYNGNNLPNVATSGGDAGAPAVGQITGITLGANDEITEQNLPLDPAGVVYDVLTRLPVAGATVTISGPAGFNPSSHLIGGTLAQTQVTGTDGRYSFWLQNAYPSGTYTLTVTSPSGYYPAPSLILPACTGGALSVGATPTPGLVQQSNDAPTIGVTQHAPVGTAPCVGMVAGGATTTQYYFSFGVTNGVTAPILNNHIPLDPVTPNKLVLTKTGDKRQAQVGDSVLYTITVRNGTGAALPQVTVKDRLPAGFTYIRGTARVGGVSVADPLGGLGPQLGFNLGTLGTGATKTLTYRVRVGVGAQQGTGINTARAYGCGYVSGCLDPGTLTPLPHGIESNEGQHKVVVVGGVFTDEACVLGKVFVDCNNNHLQDAEELGIPGVRLYFEDGKYMVSDSEGKYSRCGLTPRSHVLTPDPSTLPKGSRLTTTSNRNLGDANSLFIDLKNGELHRADFAEGSCSNPVLEQVKARRGQGEVRSVETEKRAGPALRFQSKPLSAPQQATDSANQPLVQPRQGGSDAR